MFLAEPAKVKKQGQELRRRCTESSEALEKELEAARDDSNGRDPYREWNDYKRVQQALQTCEIESWLKLV